VKGGHLEYSLVAVMRMLFCVTYLLILWTLGKCSYVTYSSLSPISVFYISQGSAATYLRFGGNIARTLLQICWRIREWNNFENQPTFVEVMNECTEVWCRFVSVAATSCAWYIFLSSITIHVASVIHLSFWFLSFSHSRIWPPGLYVLQKFSKSSQHCFGVLI